ncbi:unnamed protein product [Moneuplotes crassus]|uniref:histone acetyltransferase n=1 Tax=Euplotes crassus TaxID=5936 RepID=A0AAD1U9R9_EUPCR|nr:unnamed protein product [Moneuplotes crassus]
MNKEEGKLDCYTADANSTIKFHLVDTDKLTNSESLSAFKPMYTHQIFTYMEKIVGYMGLKIDIYLSCATLRALLKVRYTDCVKKRNTVEEKLCRHFGKNLTINEEVFQNWMKSDLDNFRPKGKKVYSFDRICDKHRHYEVYKIRVTDKCFPKELNRSLQALLFFYIESASFIEQDPCWHYFLLYEVVKKFKNNPPSYRLIGFSTTFEEIEKKKTTHRISQFIILPAYQKQGFAKALVEGIYKHYIDDKKCKEISVEKPTKAFERLCESVKTSLLKDDCKAKRVAQESGSYKNTKNTRILTSDDKLTKRKRGKGRQGEAHLKIDKKKNKDNTETGDESNCYFKDSTLSTSSLIDSEDSEWVDPFEETKCSITQKSKMVPRKTSLSKHKPRAKKRVTKEKSKKKENATCVLKRRKRLPRKVKRVKF